MGAGPPEISRCYEQKCPLEAMLGPKKEQKHTQKKAEWEKAYLYSWGRKYLFALTPTKQRLGLRHNNALACIPPARSWLLLRVMASRAREGCQPVWQTVLFLILLQKMGPLGTFLVASRKHRPHHSIHLYTPRPDYISQRPLLIHTTHKNTALASDTTKP